MLILALALQVTTTCNKVFDQTTCRSSGSTEAAPIIVAPPSNSALGGISGSIADPPKRQKKAGKILAKGDCPGAVAYALGEGDFRLAGSIRDYCARNSPK